MDTMGVDEEFDLDVRVVEAGEPVGALLRNTDDNCGSTCSGTACVSQVAYPS
jgi:FxLD family lantipeptide